MNESTRSWHNNEECVVLLAEGDGHDKNTNRSFLVGKFWIDKSFNIMAFMNTIRGVWSPRKGFEINELGKNLFIFNLILIKINGGFSIISHGILIDFYSCSRKLRVMNNPLPLIYSICHSRYELMTYL